MTKPAVRQLAANGHLQVVVPRGPGQRRTLLSRAEVVALDLDRHAVFHCGEQVIERSPSIASWSHGQWANIIPDGPALPGKPHRVEITLSFPDNDYIGHWDFNVK